MIAPRVVLCGGASVATASSAPKPLVLDVQGPRPNVFLRISDISEAMTRNVPDVLMDLLEVALYVFSADQATGRGGVRDTGRSWRRDFRFHIPVRQPRLAR